MGSSSSNICSSRPLSRKNNNSSTDLGQYPQSSEPIPFKSNLLAFSQSFCSIRSKASINQTAITTQSMTKKLGKQKITKIEKYESPLQVSKWKILSSSRGVLKHWQLIVTINDCIYWLISFAEDGLQNEVNLNKDELTARRKDNKKFEEYVPEKEVLVDHILSIIEQVKNIEYNLGEWNCQIFTDHIVNKIKSP